MHLTITTTRNHTLAWLCAGLMFLLCAGCGIKMAQLPEIHFPYVAEVEFLKNVENIDGEAQKTPFPDNHIHSPFSFFLKIKEIENDGTVEVIFYTQQEPPQQTTKVAAFSFDFGQAGKYYEYILFFDRVSDLKPGSYHYVIYLRKTLIYEGKLVID